MTLDCFVCGKKLPPATTTDQPDDLLAPHGGIGFTSRRHGASLLDRAGEFMEINVCDPCLLAGATEGRVAHGQVRVEYSEPQAS